MIIIIKSIWSLVVIVLVELQIVSIYRIIIIIIINIKLSLVTDH
jgi:hypothetical protein